MMINYTTIAPPGTFIHSYMELSSTQETPYAYDFFSGLWLISTIVGRRITINRPRAPVYLNLYAILVAESGITRKSTSVRHAVHLLRSLLSDRSIEDSIALVETKLTTGKLMDWLNVQTTKVNHAQAALAISELASVLGRGSSVRDMPVLLTDLYDCPETRRGGGNLTTTVEYRKVYVTFLSASTPSWLIRAVNPDVIEGGFTSRCLLIVSEKPKRQIAWPEERNDNERERIAKDKLGEILDSTQERSCVHIDEGALAIFSKWYATRKQGRDIFRASFAAREDSHVLRIAGLLAINGNTWTISSQHIRTAIAIVDDTKEKAAELLSFGAGILPDSYRNAERIKSALIEAGAAGVGQSALYTKVRTKNVNDMLDILRIMHELNMVQRFDVPTIGGGPTKTLWRGTKLLNADNLNELLRSRIDPETVGGLDNANAS